MTRPEDVALLRRIAQLLEVGGTMEGASSVVSDLRSLASRLEGERRDREPGYARCTSMTTGRVRCPARATKMYLATRVGIRHPVRVFRCDAHPLGNAVVVRDLPTTPTEDRQP